MTDDMRSSRAKQLREVARQFRLKAEETQAPNYIELMTRYAAELERDAEQIEATAGVGEEPSERPN